MTTQAITDELIKLFGSKDNKWTVLVVDDEPDNIELVQKVLSFHKAQVYTASNGHRGLEVLKDIVPNLVLLDISMPEMDGFEMLDHMKASHTAKNIPTIALTAHAMAGDRQRVLSAGFDGYIAKPFRLNSFLSEILRCLHEYTDKQS